MTLSAHDPSTAERVPGSGRPAHPPRGFSDAVLRAIRERVDLVDFVSTYVSLRRTGQNAVGLCPFHADKRPSFTVSPSKQLYHCFGCGAGGDLFAFVMQRESVSFPEAVQWLARKAGVALPTREASGVDRRRQALYEIHVAAADHFRKRLNGREGETARRYLRSRGLTAETLDAFGFGYAASSWDDLLAALTAKGWSPAQIQDAGLAIPRAQGGGCYDRFRHRIICPIRDAHSQVVAFGGRVLDDALPKYLNSPDTPIFTKGRHLFALDRARQSVAASGVLIVVEGYFDVIAAHQAGVTNVVATLGTALTPAHLEAIRRLVTRVCLVFDPDAAGVRAALRTVDLFAPLDLRVDVASLPPGKDPDRVIRDEGAEAFQAAVTGAVSLTEFVLDQLVPPGDYRAAAEKKSAAARALPVAGKLASAIEREHYIRWLADRIHVSESSLREEVSRPRRSDTAGPLSRPAERLPGKPSSRPWPYAEEVVASALVQGKLAPGLLATVNDDMITDGTLRRVVEMARSSPGSREADRAVQLRDQALSEGREDVAGAVARLATRESEGDDPEQEIHDCVVRLRLDEHRRRLEQLPRAIDRCQEGEQRESLQRELERLKREMIELEHSRGSRVGSPRAAAG